MGRWGNFFNCEVHGGQVPEAYWEWLPRIVFNNAHYSSAIGNGWAKEGYLYAPLFFIEFLVNLFGYFVIAHLFGIKLKKIAAPGDLAFGYIIWYGFTRVFMEPLRDSAFNMGQDGYWSWFWSLMFVAVGTLLIAVNHIVRYVLAQKNNKETNNFSLMTTSIGGAALAISSLTLILVGTLNMANNTYSPTIAFNGFNIGVICLVTGVAILFLVGAVATELIYKIKANPQGAANA